MVRLWLGMIAALAIVTATANAADSPSAKTSTVSPEGAAATPAQPAKSAKTTTASETGPQVAVLETSQGTIVIKFFDDTPKTVTNFKKLVRQKFYDGTYFHRVITGFMIQGGDPNTKNADASDDGVGGPGYTVPAEIKLAHLRG